MPGPTQPGGRTAAWKYQDGHGFRRGQPVYLQAAGRYALASVDTGYDGLVGDVALQRFELVTGGELDGLIGLAPNVVYSLTVVAGQLSPGSAYPVYKALAADTASLISANAGTDGTDVVLPFTVSVTPIPNGVPQAGANGKIDAGWVDVTVPGGVTGLQLLQANAPLDARVVLQEEPIDRVLSYTGELLTGTSDAYGTQVLSYDVNNRLTGITGTGKYRSKTFNYTGDQLTSIDVL